MNGDDEYASYLRLLDTMTREDFNHLDKLNRACLESEDRDIQTIMIDYFEKRPKMIYGIAQSMMARRYGMEAP